MKNKLVGGLALAAWMAFLISGCSGEKRGFGQAQAGAQSAGASGAGDQGRGGSQASAGDRGLAGMGDASGAASAEAGAGGEAGASCQGSECGECAGATPAPGTACGECGEYACNADQKTTSCSDPKFNACGGCGAISGAVGSSCGPCSVTACASDKNSLVCNAQCTGTQVCVSGLNQCKSPDCSAADSCGKSDGAGSTCTNAKGNCAAKPNSTGQCAGSSCGYTCKTKTLSCSTAAEPACGTWNFESKTPEGWRLDPTVWGTNDAANKVKGLYLAAPPGAGAGSFSLAVDVDGSTGKDGTMVLVELCPGTAAATGILGKFHASVWWKPSDSNGALGGPGYAYWLPQGGGTDVNCPAGVWFDVPSQAVAGANITHVGVSIGGISGHKGTLYFDNIYFE